MGSNFNHNLEAYFVTKEITCENDFLKDSSISGLLKCILKCLVSNIYPVTNDCMDDNYVIGVLNFLYYLQKCKQQPCSS